MRSWRGGQRLKLRLEERLVDLALVDRHALLQADADDLLALDPELLRQLLRRQVIRHSQLLLCTHEKARRRIAHGRARPLAPLSTSRESTGPRPQKAHRSTG